MYRYYLLFLLLFFARNGSATAIDGLDGIETVISALVIAAIDLFIMFGLIINRITQKEYKVSNGLNVSAVILMICAFVAMSPVLSGNDPGFIAVCAGAIVFALLIISLNNLLGKKKHNRS